MSEVIEKNVFLSSSMRETGLERNRISCFFEDLEGLKERLSQKNVFRDRICCKKELTP